MGQIKIPSEFAFCFLSSSLEQCVHQIIEVSKLEKLYTIEKWFRFDKNTDNYSSFSQLINDAINETESEFMIFCNPKTHFNFSDINDIIHKLCNGNCFVSLVNFGLFGMTKELIRRIGMFDENFLFGEYEDNDFALRLNYYNKSVWWDYDYSKYSNTKSQYNNLRGISSSYFDTKYRYDNYTNTFYIGKNYLNYKKIDKKHSKFKPEIFESWDDKEKSVSKCSFGDLVLQPKVEIDYLNEEILLSDFNVEVVYENGYVKITLHSEINFPLHFLILKDLTHGRKSLYSEKVYSNNWFLVKYLIDLDNGSSNYTEDIEIRLFLQGNQIYTNTISQGVIINQNFKLPIKIRK